MPHTLSQHAIAPELLAVLLSEHRTKQIPRLTQLWRYYRNAIEEVFDSATQGGRRRLGQEVGLPTRITHSPGASPGSSPGSSKREVVIENDIAWRVHTLVDFMFARPVTIQSLAPAPQRSDAIEAFLNDVIDANGGVSLFQDMALLGSVYGFVDVLVHVRDGCGDIASARQDAQCILFDVIDPPRAIPLLNPCDYRRLDGYILNYQTTLNEIDGSPQPRQRNVLGRVGGLLRELRGMASGGRGRKTVERTEVWTDRTVEFREGSVEEPARVEREVNRLGVLPVVHIQNLPQPFFYEGLSEVEPLIPLQDELNTRLSDRANRVTFQSFKMYLGRGIDGFLDRPVGPGQMWATDNPGASILEFGGDGVSPSEESHIHEIREAMDKASAVTALAAGLLRNKVGNLSSENAIRIVMMGLLSRTEKKRVTYGAGIARMCELALHAAHVHGIFATRPDERRVRLHWPSPLPEDSGQRLREAQLKLSLGVPSHQVLTELGYGADAPHPHAPLRVSV